LSKFLTPELIPVGKKIIEACLNGAGVDEYNAIIPMHYHYSFRTMEDYENGEDIQ
jgi:hypothetical protein